jgi:hypothetical protein
MFGDGANRAMLLYRLASDKALGKPEVFTFTRS